MGKLTDKVERRINVADVVRAGTEIILPEGLTEDALQETLEEVGSEAGVEISLRPLESDTL